MGLLETAWDATNREQDEKILIGGLADFSLRAEIREYLPMLSGKDFWNPNYGHIWDVAKLLASEDRIITLAPFREHLTEQEYKTLESYQGMGVRLVEIKHGIGYVRDAAKSRALLQGLKDVAVVAAKSEKYDQVIGHARQVIEASDTATLSGHGVEMADLADQWWHEVENPVENVVMPSPWKKVNEALPGGGFSKGAVTIVAAETGRGKSLAMSETAAQVALAGYNVAFFSMEMTASEVYDRVLAAVARVSVSAVSRRMVADDPNDPAYYFSADRQKVDEASELLKATSFRVWDESEMTLDWIRQQCVAMKQTVGLDMVLIDYIQILESGSDSNRSIALANDAKKMKQMAKALDVHVFSASQMNELERDQKPTTSSLRESRGIGHNANTVFFIVHELTPEGDITGNADFVFAKNRGGRMCTLNMVFEGHQARFSD